MKVTIEKIWESKGILQLRSGKRCTFQRVLKPSKYNEGDDISKILGVPVRITIWEALGKVAPYYTRLVTKEGKSIIRYGLPVYVHTCLTNVWVRDRLVSGLKWNYML